MNALKIHSAWAVSAKDFRGGTPGVVVYSKWFNRDMTDNSAAD